MPFRRRLGDEVEFVPLGDDDLEESELPDSEDPIPGVRVDIPAELREQPPETAEQRIRRVRREEDARRASRRSSTPRPRVRSGGTSQYPQFVPDRMEVMLFEVGEDGYIREVSDPEYVRPNFSLGQMDNVGDNVRLYFTFARSHRLIAVGSMGGPVDSRGSFQLLEEAVQVGEYSDVNISIPRWW